MKFFSIICTILLLNQNVQATTVNKCYFEQGYTILILACSGTTGQSDIFSTSNGVTCYPKYNSYTIYRNKYYIDSVKFEDCDRPQIPSNFFDLYSSLRSVNMSHLNLTSLQTCKFTNKTNLNELILSHNQIEEIPILSFHEAKQITRIDFSYNKIKKINAFAFTGEFNLKDLDLSSNQITALQNKIFEEHSELQYLNVSKNWIEKLDKGFFTNLNNLMLLNLSHNCLSEIRAETFSSLSSLEKIDISNNKLKILNADIFPSFTYGLTSIFINNNQLHEMNGFIAKNIPHATFIGFESNAFNCSFLNSLFDVLTWNHIKSTSKLIECSSDVEKRGNQEITETSTSTVPVSTKTERVPLDDREHGHENHTEDKKNYTKTTKHTHQNFSHSHSVDADSSRHLIVTAWINSICLIVLVITAIGGILYFLMRKGILNREDFAKVIYRRTGEP